MDPENVTPTEMLQFSSNSIISVQKCVKVRKYNIQCRYFVSVENL